MSVDLKKRLVRMSCCDCGGERGAELPALFLKGGCTSVCCMQFCTWCSGHTPHNLLGHNMVQLYRAR